MKKIVFSLILALLTLSIIGTQSAKSNLSTLTVPDDFPTIQTAIDNAFAGQTILVRAGVYYEQHITVDKSLSLVGEDPETTFLVGINNLRYSPPYIIRVSADNVRVSGFTITNGSLGAISVETVGSDAQPSGCVITGNHIMNNTGGIITYDGEDIIISNNCISNNTDFGISLSTSQSKIFGNNITENGWAGITIDSCEEVSVFSNYIVGNGKQKAIDEYSGGIILRWKGSFEICNNSITGNYGHGVQFGEGCSNSLVHDNNIKGNSVGVELFNFILTDNSEGIGIGTGSKVYRNNIDNNRNAYVMTAYPYGNISDIAYAIGNGTDIVSWDNGAVGNYWSDHDGQGTYVIDEDNIDHYPRAHEVEISASPLEPEPFPAFIVIASVIAVAAVVVLGLLVYLKKRPKTKSS